MLKRQDRIRRTVRGRQATRRAVPRIEALESRLVLSNTGFLQGTVFIDNSGKNVDNGGTFDPSQGNTPVSGAIVSLFDQNNNFVSSMTTGSNGAYLFTGLAPGTYTLTETPPTGYANDATEVNSPLDPVTATTSSSITVQVEDLSNLSVTYDATYVYANLLPGVVTFEASPDGGTTYLPQDFTVSQMPVTVNYPGGTTAQFSAFCVDVFAGLDYGVDTFSASGQPLSTALVPPTNAAAIAYLYNQYSSFLNQQFGQPISNTASAPTNPFTTEQALEAQALQLAIWKLIYDTGSNLQTFSTGNISDLAIDPNYVNYPGVYDDPSITDLENRAISYIDQALNQSAQAIELDAISGSNGLQNLVAPGSLNFSNPASPTINTVAGGTVTIGSGAKLTDSATLSGGANPGGSITFYLFAPGVTPLANDSNNVYSDTVTVSGNGPYNTSTGTNSGGYVPPSGATGTYQWVAVYSGDPSNSGATSSYLSEPEMVCKASSSVSTAIDDATTNQPLSSGGESAGAKVYDTATVTRMPFTPMGTVTYDFYATATPVYGTTTPSTTQTVTLVAGVVPNSAVTAALAAGSDAYIAVYSGDSNYAGSTGAVEPLTVGKASPAIVTTPNPNIVTRGTCTLLTDSATLSGGFNPTGSITFTLVAPGSSSPVDTETVAVHGDGTFSTPNGYTLPSNATPGIYQWNASYSDDGNNKPASDNNDVAEQVDVVTPCCNLQNVSYSVYNPNTQTTTVVTDLRGNTQQGDTVTATFTVPAGYFDQLSLVSYTAVESSFNSDDADLQGVYQSVTQVFGPGTHTLGPVTLPSSFYQVDFVCGSVITTLGLNSNDFYSAQSRLISADNEGTNPVGSPELQVQGTVFCDQNDNGIQNSSDAGLAGVTVTLTGTDFYGNPVSQTATTNSTGGYTIAGMPFSNSSGYTVTVSVPSGDTAGVATAGKVNGTADGSATSSPEAINTIVMRNSVQTNGTSYNFGIQQPVSIAGKVYSDSNGNGKLDSGESGLSGVTITLYNSSGTKVSSTTTSGYGSSAGSYSFTNLAPGTYSLLDTVLNGYVGTGSDVGSVGGNADGSSLSSTKLGSIVLSSGQTGSAYDFGMAQPVCISGVVYNDCNGNGKFNNGDSGINGVTITLYNSSGVAVASTTTSGFWSSAGSYSFTNLAPGTYSLVETVPGGYTATGSDVGNDGGTSVSSTNIGAIVLTSGQAGSNYDFGLQKKS